VTAPRPAWRVARWYCGRHDDGLGGWFGDRTEFEDFICPRLAREACEAWLEELAAGTNARLKGVELYPIILYPHTEEDAMPDLGHGPCSDCQPDETYIEQLRNWWRKLRLPRHRRGGLALA
jgi:hypothetical protein